jgi:hypothetical protein
MTNPMSGRTGPERPRWSPGPAGGGAGPVPAAVRGDAHRATQSLAPAPVLPLQSQEHSIVSSWPFQSYLELGALPSAVPCARLHARQVLYEWRLADLADAELVVSELVTNGDAPRGALLYPRRSREELKGGSWA